MPFIDPDTFDTKWGYTASGGIHRLQPSPLITLTEYNTPRYINFVLNYNIEYKQEKNYQFVTTFFNDAFPTFGVNLHFKLSSPFVTSTQTFSQTSAVAANAFDGARAFVYGNPSFNQISNQVIQIGADNNLNAYTPNRRIIKRVDLYEIDFLISGYRAVATGSNTQQFSYGQTNTPRGWYYNYLEQSYWWNWNSGGINPVYSTIGSGLPSTPTYNFIARKIEYDYINLKFDYATFSGASFDGVDMYLGTNLADRGTWQMIGSLKGMTVSSVTHQLFGLTGTNTNGSKNYLIITGSQSLSPTFTAKISNIQVYGGYHPQNNSQFLFTNSLIYSNPTPLQILNISSATYSFIVGWGTTIGNSFSNVSLVKSKMGNGLFRAGIWENGIWNNGWRQDDNSKDFDDIIFSIAVSKGVKWRIQIVGPESSVENFEIGDRVSIGNIVGIDINGERKLFRGIFTIIKKNVESIVVEVETTFPFRRIEKDSQNHKIKITKNVWLSGAFLNGFFTGVWNSGLFKGFPFLTEMYRTQWIDGKFDGGHINSTYPTANFNDTYYIVANDWGLDSSFEGKLGLTFSSGHPYEKGDWIVIDKTLKTLNPQYDGAAQVLEVIDSRLIVLDKSFGDSSNMEGGFTFRWTATSLLQNLNFYDNNRSTRTSNQSSVAGDVFSFNSWMDLNYDPTRSVSISRPIKDFDKISTKSVNRNNLYGYPTYDILSSNSWFRDSFSLQQRSYRLGTKYKIFEDPIAEGSNFAEPFEPQVFTDEIILQFTKKKRNSSGGSISFASSQDFILRIVPTATSEFNFRRPQVICQVTEDTNPSTMASLVATSIGNGYTASVDDTIVTIRDLNGNSYGRVGLQVEGTNYDLRSDNSAGGLIVIYPSQRVFEYSTPEESKNDRGQSREQSQERTISRSISIDQEPIRFGRVIEGVGYDNLTNAGWRITQASFSNSDIRRTEPSETIDYIKGEEMQISLVRDGVTLNNDNIQIESGRYSVVEFDVMSYSVNDAYYRFNNTNTAFTRRGLQTSPTVNLPIIHLSNLNYDYLDTSRAVTTFNNSRFRTEVNRQYLPLSYLPIKDNINHLFTENTFRLDSVEEVSPTRFGGFGENRETKKYEYFYGKKDLMLKILGNGSMGASPSSIVLDNIKMYEVDMIPFFQYFTFDHIYKGVQVPFQARAPIIDYSDSDFQFLDNISIGLDSINVQQSLVPILNSSGGISTVQTQVPTIRPNLQPSTPRLIFDLEENTQPDTAVPVQTPLGFPINNINSSL